PCLRFNLPRAYAKCSRWNCRWPSYTTPERLPGWRKSLSKLSLPRQIRRCWNRSFTRWRCPNEQFRRTHRSASARKARSFDQKDQAWQIRDSLDELQIREQNEAFSFI